MVGEFMVCALRLAEPDGRQLAMTYLDIHATPDMSVFADEAAEIFVAFATCPVVAKPGWRWDCGQIAILTCCILEF